MECYESREEVSELVIRQLFPPEKCIDILLLSPQRTGMRSSLSLDEGRDLVHIQEAPSDSESRYFSNLDTAPRK